MWAIPKSYEDPFDAFTREAEDDDIFGNGFDIGEPIFAQSLDLIDPFDAATTARNGI